MIALIIIGWLALLIFAIWLSAVSLFCFTGAFGLGKPDSRSGLIILFICLVVWYFVAATMPFQISVGATQ